MDREEVVGRDVAVALEDGKQSLRRDDDGLAERRLAGNVELCVEDEVPHASSSIFPTWSWPMNERTACRALRRSVSRIFR